ncbi:MAG: dicarboxylate/amino acid:cation symporter [Dorea sp.]|nr:dicarboxylate/amino acid:cation symporter [Dorea sp.]
MEGIRRFSKSLTIQIICASIAGFLASPFISPWTSYLSLVGNLFLRVFQIFVVFYVMATVTGAVLSGEAQDMGRMGIHTFKWIITFTLISAGIGVLLSAIIKPGAGFSISGQNRAVQEILEVSTNTGGESAIYRLIHSLTEESAVPYIVLAIFFGVAIGAYAKESQNPGMTNWLQRIYHRAYQMMKKIMYFVPLAIFCLIVNVANGVSAEVILSMAKFLLLLCLGNLIQFVLFVPLTAYLTKTRISLIVKKLVKLSVLALTTTSGAICLLVKNEEEVVKFGVSRKVADFTGPITMSMNSCGAVQCYVAAIFFLAHSTDATLSVYQILMAIFLSILMCMGTISVPGGSAMVYAFLAASLGLSTEGIAILISVDWIAGMFRTLMNVDVDVLVGMLVASRLGELEHEVFYQQKKVTYL